MKYVCHFSCGVTSAVATLLTILEHGRENVEIVYADPGAEHEDNRRFRRDFEELAGMPVNILHSAKYDDIYQVFEKRRFLVSPAGAPCTLEMKKLPIQEYLKDRIFSEVQVIGYTGDEAKRIHNWKKANPMVALACPLVDKMLDKKDCMAICGRLSLRLPEMYRLGYSNANCIGCVKASSLGYWAAIRADFPERFEWVAKFERAIGAVQEDGTRKGGAVCKKSRKATPEEVEDGLADKNGNMRIRVFLDEIPKTYPQKRNVSISCGYSCGMQDMEEIEDQLTGEPSLLAYLVEEDLLAEFK